MVSRSVIVALSASLLALSACKGGEEEELERLDTYDARVVLESPAAGSWSPAGTIVATGRAKDTEAVTVMGQETRLDAEGAFRAEVELPRGISVVEASAKDPRGQEAFARNGVIAGDFVDPEGAVERAMAVRLNQGGLDDVLGLVGGYLEPATISSAATGLNPVYDDAYGVWGWDAVEIRADLEAIDFSTPQLEVSPSRGELTLSVALPDLLVELYAEGEAVGIDFDSDVTLMAERAEITGTLALDVEDGDIVAELVDAEVSLVGFSYDTSLLPGAVEDYLFVETIRGKIEEMLLVKIEEMVPSLLSDSLAGLDPSFDLELLGTPLSVAAGFASLSIDEQGVSLVVDVDSAAPAAGTKTYEGVLTTGHVSPAADSHADLGISISDDLLNDLLFELWRAGLMDMELSTDAGNLPVGLLAALGDDEGTLTTEAVLPPVVVQTESGFQLQFAELLLHIETENGKGEILDFALAGFVDLDLEVVDGAIGLDLGEPELVIEARSALDGETIEGVTRTFEDKLPIDSLLLLVSALEFELPTLYGLSVADAAVDRASDGAHTDIRVTVAAAD